MVGCLGNSRLCHQWECTSVGAGCLGNGGRPSHTELHHPWFSCARSETLHHERLESPFCLSHCAGPNTVSLESPGLAHCPSLIQSEGYANLPSQVSDCQFNRAPGPVCFVGSTVVRRCAACLLLAAPAKTSALASHVSFIPGNFPVLWATKIRLEMQP